jgi:hypothetical protein
MKYKQFDMDEEVFEGLYSIYHLDCKIVMDDLYSSIGDPLDQYVYYPVLSSIREELEE